MEWTPDLSVGVSMIDEQHKTWFKKADDLFEAGKKHQAKEYVGQLLDFLDDYTKKHFNDEEQYMVRIKYPEFNAQKQAHTVFIEQLKKLKKEYSESGGNILVIINANQLVIGWLTSHISNMDKRIGQYAKTLEK
jgi:hemerythrin